MSGSALRLARAALLLALATPAPAQDPAAGGLEGPLRSDALVTSDEAAAQLLAAGDAELGGMRPGALSGERPASEDDRRRALAAFARWSEALARSEPGAVVPLDLSPWIGQSGFRWPDPEGSFARRHEAIEYALLRRLHLLPEPLRALWREREATVARADLAAAGRGAAALAAVEHAHPGTRAAALAALRRFELEFERGREALARGWLGRAAVHARLARQPEIAAGIAAREAVLWSRVDPPPPAAAWQRAGAVRPAGAPLVIPLADTRRRRLPTAPGLAFLPGGRVAVQHSGVVWVADPGGREGGFEPARLVEQAGLGAPGAVGGPDGTWAHVPVADGEKLFLVVGRAGPAGSRGTRTWQSNLVCAVRPTREGALPELLWCLGPQAHLGPDGGRTPLAEVLGPGMWEFQPGPLRVGSLLVVQARQWALEEQDGELEAAAPGEASIRVLALDAATGAPVWTRELGRGTDLVPDLGLRFRRKYMVRTGAQPLRVAGERLFVGTNLGLAQVLDLADGRLVWSFANRRRAAETPGWRALRAPPVTTWQEDGRARTAVLWAPADSDRLYTLRLAPDLDGAGLLVFPPQPIGEAEELVGGDLERFYVLGRAGARRTLSAIEPATGRRADSIYLGRDERFLPGALAGGGRAVAVTGHGLYLFDLARELYLLQHLPLELDADAPAGGLYARGDELWLVADGRLWPFRVD